MKLNIYQLLFILILMLCPLEASRTLDYDQIRMEGGFISSTLFNVSHIIATKNSLTDLEKIHLTSGSILTNLKTLDLTNQNIDDNFIQALSNNPSLKRIINLDISNNINITNKAIDYIVNSDILGSIRDSQKISGQHGAPSSIINIKAGKTNIDSNFSNKERFNFKIKYLDTYGRKILQDIKNGVKIIEITF